MVIIFAIDQFKNKLRVVEAKLCGTLF